MLKTDGLLTVEVLVAVFLGMLHAAVAIRAPRPPVVHLPLAPRRRHFTKAGPSKRGATLGCAACCEIAVQGVTATPHTDECRARIGERMEHGTEGHERLQVHKRRQMRNVRTSGSAIC